MIPLVKVQWKIKISDLNETYDTRNEKITSHDMSKVIHVVHD